MDIQPFSVYSDRCYSRNVLEGISDKWSILILTALSTGVFRFGELRRKVGGISQKMLTQTLKKLLSYGFIDRRSFPVLPMHVEYSLTPLGRELTIILNQLTFWTEKNMENIMANEEKFTECEVL